MKLIIKKGADIPSVIFIVIVLLAIGILFVFTNNLSQEIFDEFGNRIEAMPQYDENTTAVTAIRSIEDQNTRVWDYSFLFISLFFLFALGILAFSTRISPIFYWAYGVLGMLLFTIAIIMSNMWQEFIAADALSSTAANFPITNAILGTYYPSLVLGAIILGMILLFGKSPGGEQRWTQNLRL